MNFGGYIPLRRGVLEHLHTGRITGNEFIAFMIILMLADAGTGIAVTNAPALVTFSGGALSVSSAKKALEGLERKRYIKRRLRAVGSRGVFPILVDKFVCTVGSLRLKQLTFAQTTDWENPVYDDMVTTTPEVTPETQPEVKLDDGRETGPETGPYIKREKGKGKQETRNGVSVLFNSNQRRDDGDNKPTSDWNQLLEEVDE